MFKNIFADPPTKRKCLSPEVTEVEQKARDSYLFRTAKEQLVTISILQEVL